MKRLSATERFLANLPRVKSPDECWLWQGYTKVRYGALFVDGKEVYAHRFSYEFFRGPIPDGLEIDHTCETRPCVNPAHLEPVTGDENKRRYFANRGRKTEFCVAGHLLDAANTYVRPRQGWRECRACKARKLRDWKKARELSRKQ